MNLIKYKPDELTSLLSERLKDFDCRERIVIKFPFSSTIKRVEIYCSEVEPDRNSAGTALFGQKLNGITSIQVFTDYSNKPANKSSYSYKKELLNYIPKLVGKMFAASIEKV
jgi:hypothetical protein